MTASSVAHSAHKNASAKEERKLRKPLIERKRRERINNCLDQLKEAVIGAFRLDQSKLEKADILEMTVKHLQNIQNSKVTAAEPMLGLEAQQRYSTGYIQCMHEVHNMLLTCDWMDKTLGSRLLNHLLKSLPTSNDERLLQATPRHDIIPPDCKGPDLLGTPLRGDPHLQKEESPPSHRHQERPPLHSFHLGTVQMWRPW
ncbi:hairy-related 8.2 [Thalassophryne amazonica]|uniref:hairy-related 8.2 n=1 Tax=Thalassophryne amazonica TaxID=390379 RepID=UPI001471228A|nr:hairy-related 8.2 [Thalassophryne amazonica]